MRLRLAVAVVASVSRLAATMALLSATASCADGVGGAGGAGGVSDGAGSGRSDGGDPDARLGDAQMIEDAHVAEPDGSGDLIRDAGAARSDGGARSDGECPSPPSFSFKCDPQDPTTCPSGFCIVSQCIAAQVDPTRYDGCGDGKCGACESAATCPADCAPSPTVSGKKVYDDPNTLTVILHGFSNHSAASLKTQVYGAVTGCGDQGRELKTYGENAPCGDDPMFDLAPNQIVGVEYYGAVAPAWMTPQDVMEVEQYPYLGGPTGLQRYGLIVAKFIKWRMAHTGATHVNLVCHSMGCLLARYVIENDIEQLASRSLIVRWVTAAGVVGGAQLARLYNNPAIQQGADSIGLAVDDFALMDPAYVQTYAASFDHKLSEGNNPLFAGILIHHVGATDPRVGAAFNLQLLNLDNPQQLPNDGIMYTFDEMFLGQAAAASVSTPSGEVVSATHAFIHVGHMDATAGDDYGAALAAGLFHKRRVYLTLEGLTLKKDHEFSLATPLELGTAPAEVVAETRVSYDPYTMPKYATHTLVDDDELAFHSPDMSLQTVGGAPLSAILLYAGPIFDDQTSLHLKLTLTEADFYARYDVMESLAGTTDKKLLAYESDLTLMDQTLPITDDGASGSIRVHVLDLY